jgi:AhpD family alkylhydroperoxidase
VSGRGLTPTLAEWLACYRLVRLVQRDDVWPLPEVRNAIMDRWGTSRWSALLDCPWCLSVHAALALGVLRSTCPRLHAALVAILAASAVTGLITEAEMRLAGP